MTNSKTTRVVVDASLAAAFLLREPSGESFDVLLHGVAHGNLDLMVPALFPFEMANVLVTATRRDRISPAQRDRHFEELTRLPFQVEPPPGRMELDAMLQLAARYNLSAYDAAYLELAQRRQARLASLDDDILRLKPTLDWIL